MSVFSLTYLAFPMQSDFRMMQSPLLFTAIESFCKSPCLSPFFWSLRCLVLFFFSKLYYQLFSIFVIIFLFSLASYILFCTATQFCFLAVLVFFSSCVFPNVFAGWISQSPSSKCQWWEIAMISGAANMNTEYIGRHEK